MQTDRTLIPFGFVFLLALRGSRVSAAEERRTEGTWEAEQRMTLVGNAEEDARQIWSGEEEGKETNKAQKNAATGECPFCFYNILCDVTAVSMKTVITPCVWVMSQSGFLCPERLFRDF